MNHSILPTKQQILSVVDNAAAPCLDEQIIFDDEKTLSILLDLLKVAGCGQEAVASVPIRNVIGLPGVIQGVRQVYGGNEPLTWRQAVSALDMRGWGDREIAYLNSNNHSHEFPSPGAKKTLTLAAYGGTVICTNCKHRLVASKGWLAGKHGDDAVLGQVQTTFYRLHPLIRDLIGLDSRTADPTFHYSFVQPRDTMELESQIQEKPKLLIRLGHPTRYFYWTDQESLIPIRVPRFVRLRQFFSGRHDVMDYQQRDWVPLPDAVRRTLLDDRWCAEQQR